MPLWGKGSSDKPKYLTTGAPNHDPEDCFATAEGWVLRHYKGHDKNTAPYWDEVLVSINGIDLGGGGGTYKIFVGAPGDDTNGTDQGAVYSYNFDGTNEQKFYASDATDGVQFGTAIAIADGKIIIGAPGPGTNKAAYIYDLDGTNEVKFTPVYSAANPQNWGYNVEAGDGKIILKNKSEPLGSDANVGAIFTYDMDGTNENVIRASDAAAGRYWPEKMAQGNSKIVAADNRDNNHTGAIYIYDMDGTNEIKVVGKTHFIPGQTIRDNFGSSVFVAENKIAAGARIERLGPYPQPDGQVRLYDLDGTNELVIDPPTSGSQYGFGMHDIVISGGKLFVANSQFTHSGVDRAGIIYVYSLDGTYENEIKPSDPFIAQEFGTVFSVINNKVFVSNHRENSNTGSYYIFDVDGTNQQKVTPSDAGSSTNALFGIGIIGSAIS